MSYGDTVIRPSVTVRQAVERLGWVGVDPYMAVRCFQGGWALGDPLVVDGRVGPKTRSALLISLDRMLRGQGTASQNFSFREFVCKCGGRFADCGRVWVKRPLLVGLQELRAAAYPSGLSVISGCRCPQYNRSLGGATSSQHMNGVAADVPPAATVSRVRGLRRFSGMGYNPAGLVRHVDMRHITGPGNTTGGSVETPTTWPYTS